MQKGRFKIVRADADKKTLLVSRVKLASVVTTTFEQKKLSHITSQQLFRHSHFFERLIPAN